MVCLLCENNKTEINNEKQRRYLKHEDPICNACYIDFLEFVLDHTEVIPIDLELVYMNFFSEGKSWYDCALCPDNELKRKYLYERTGWCDWHYTLFLENLIEFLNIPGSPADQSSSYEYYKIKLTPQRTSAEIKKSKTKSRKKLIIM